MHQQGETKRKRCIQSVKAKLEVYPEPVEGLRDRPAGMRALQCVIFIAPA